MEGGCGHLARHEGVVGARLLGERRIERGVEERDARARLGQLGAVITQQAELVGRRKLAYSRDELELVQVESELLGHSPLNLSHHGRTRSCRKRETKAARMRLGLDVILKRHDALPQLQLVGREGAVDGARGRQVEHRFEVTRQPLEHEQVESGRERGRRQESL